MSDSDCFIPLGATYQIFGHKNDIDCHTKQTVISVSQMCYCCGEDMDIEDIIYNLRCSIITYFQHVSCKRLRILWWNETGLSSLNTSMRWVRWFYHHMVFFKPAPLSLKCTIVTEKIWDYSSSEKLFIIWAAALLHTLNMSVAKNYKFCGEMKLSYLLSTP